MAPKDPKLSDRGGRRGPCMAGEKAEAGSRGRGSRAGRCSTWLGVAAVPVTLDKPGLAETHLSAHDVKHEHSLAIVAVKNSTWSLDNLAVARLSHLGRTGTALRVLHKLLNVPENPLNKTPRRRRVFESDVIGNGVEVMESRFRPD